MASLLLPVTVLYDDKKVVEAECWAHARRPWWDLYLSLGRDRP